MRDPVNAGILLLLLVLALSFAPLIAPWGKWLWLAICAFVLAESALIASVEREAIQPDFDGPAGMFVGLVFLMPAAVFIFCILVRVAYAAVDHFLRLRNDLKNYKQQIREAQKRASRVPHA